MMRKLALVGLLLAAGCSTEATQPGPIGTTSSKLVGGTTNTGDPAVVLFDVAGGGCTAVFVAKTVLLTAAHCVIDDNLKPATSGARIFRGNDQKQAKETDWITIAPENIHPHPQYDGDKNDLAVLVLSSPVEVTPFPMIARALASGDVGQSIRIVGYGANVSGTPQGDDGFGLKRTLTTKVVSVKSTGFVEVGKKGATACGGDSGGPALMKIDGVETIVGLDSYSDAQVDCTGTEFYQRIDTQKDFIAPFMKGVDTTSGGKVEQPGSGDDNSPATNDSNDDEDSDDSDKKSDKKSSKTGVATTTAQAGCTLVSRQTSPDVSAILVVAVCVLGLRRKRR